MRRPTGVGRAGAGAPAVTAPAAHARFVRPPPRGIGTRVIPVSDSLAEALRASFSPDSCRLIAVREHGDAAVALFDTRPSAEPYLYEVHYHRENDRWLEGSSGNGPGWHRLRPDSDIGVVTVWEESPPGADRVRAELDGRVVEEAVVNGVYFLVWWDVPLSHAQVTGFRVNGEWARAPTMWERFNAERDKWLRAQGL